MKRERRELAQSRYKWPDRFQKSINLFNDNRCWKYTSVSPTADDPDWAPVAYSEPFFCVRFGWPSIGGHHFKFIICIKPP